jgi:hypothetical protein
MASFSVDDVVHFSVRALLASGNAECPVLRNRSTAMADGKVFWHPASVQLISGQKKTKDAASSRAFSEDLATSTEIDLLKDWIQYELAARSESAPTAKGVPYPVNDGNCIVAGVQYVRLKYEKR